jgi:hypothetical protein
MILKFTILFLALLNGGWMVFDGIHVLRKGKYFGPDIPGLWSKIVSSVGINPFKLGPVFVALGVAWLVLGFAVFFTISWAWLALLICSVLTMWYLKVGTVISIIVAALLVLFQANLGYA